MAVAEEAVVAAAARAAVERVADLVVAEWEENMDRGDLEVAWEAKRVAWFGCGVQILQQGSRRKPSLERNDDLHQSPP